MENVLNMESNLLSGKRWGAKMITMLELAIAAIALAWLMMIVAIAFFYLKIDKEEREITRIKKKIDFHEESIKKISRFFVAIKGEQSTV
jgi:cell division protein FtsL